MDLIKNIKQIIENILRIENKYEIEKMIGEECIKYKRLYKKTIKNFKD